MLPSRGTAGVDTLECTSVQGRIRRNCARNTRIRVAACAATRILSSHVGNRWTYAFGVAVGEAFGVAAGLATGDAAGLATGDAAGEAAGDAAGVDSPVLAGTAGTTPDAGEAAGLATGLAPVVVAGEAAALAAGLAAGVDPMPAAGDAAGEAPVLTAGVDAIPAAGDAAALAAGLETELTVGDDTVATVGAVVGASTCAFAVGVSAFLLLPPPQLTSTKVLRPKASAPYARRFLNNDRGEVNTLIFPPGDKLPSVLPCCHTSSASELRLTQ